MRVAENSYTTVCPPVPEIIHLVKLVDYLLLQGDKPCYNYYLYNLTQCYIRVSTLMIETPGDLV